MERRLSLPAREDIVARPSLVGRPREIVELIFYWSFLAPNEFQGEFWGRFAQYTRRLNSIIRQPLPF
jgi:hypothetical protein